MDFNDLYKLAGIQRNDTPAVEPTEVEPQIAEQPVDGNANMKAMIALISPEQLNQLVGDAPVSEEMPGEATTEPNPEAYKGTLGSPSDNSLRRYLDANGDHVKVDETVYTDHKVEDINEAWNAYKAVPVVEEPNEGNEFSGNRQDAIDAGEDEFEVDGKKYKVKEEAVTEGDVPEVEESYSPGDENAEGMVSAEREEDYSESNVNADEMSILKRNAGI